MNILLPIGELSKNLRKRESNKIDVKTDQKWLEGGKEKDWYMQPGRNGK